MRSIGRDVLERASRRHPDARSWLLGWAATVEDAAWQSLEYVRVDYPSADGVKLESRIVITVFNVRGNTYRLLTHIDYPGQVAQALEVLTPAEYDKERWKTRY